jgi:hypothetical protein
MAMAGGADGETVPVKRGRVGSINLYEIKDNELDQLESGSPGDLQLNFAVFLFSIAFASFTTLLTVEKYTYRLAETAFLFVVIIGVLMGSYLLWMAVQLRKSQKNLCKNIRGRLVEGEPVEAEVGPGVAAEDQARPS